MLLLAVCVLHPVACLCIIVDWQYLAGSDAIIQHTVHVHKLHKVCTKFVLSNGIGVLVVDFVLF